MCDTQDFIRVDTKNVTTSDGVTHSLRFAVIGDPCLNEERLGDLFIQPFDGRETSLLRDAPEVRCSERSLVDATFSDNGLVIISMFFDMDLDSDGQDLSLSSVHVPTPGRMHTSSDGVLYQDQSDWVEHCAKREAAGYNSGMGEIFRRAAAVTRTIPPSDVWRKQLESYL